MGSFPSWKERVREQGGFRFPFCPPWIESLRDPSFLPSAVEWRWIEPTSNGGIGIEIRFSTLGRTVPRWGGKETERPTGRERRGNEGRNAILSHPAAHASLASAIATKDFSFRTLPFWMEHVPRASLHRRNAVDEHAIQRRMHVGLWKAIGQSKGWRLLLRRGKRFFLASVIVVVFWNGLSHVRTGWNGKESANATRTTSIRDVRAQPFDQQRSEPKRRLSAVLPTYWKDRTFFENFVRTCSNVLHEGVVTELFVVVPEPELELFGSTFGRTMPTHWRLIDEKAAVPEFESVGLGHAGWQRQMDIKIAIFRNVTEEFYLTLDADNFCTGSDLEPDRFFDGRGRAIACVESDDDRPRFFGQKNAGPTKVALDLESVGQPGFLMGWTPQLLSSSMLQDVHNHFVQEKHTSLVDFLLTTGRTRDTCIRHCRDVWTEYLAYFFLGLHYSVFDVYHDPRPVPGIDIGICYAKEGKALPDCPFCLKLRIVCEEDSFQLFQLERKKRPVFGVLNDHQLSDEQKKNMTAQIQHYVNQSGI